MSIAHTAKSRMTTAERVAYGVGRLTSIGLSRNAALGVMGALAGESGRGLNTRAHNKADPNGGSYGIAQHHSGRRRAMERYVEKVMTANPKKDVFEAQMDFVLDESQKKYSKMLDRIKALPDDPSSRLKAVREWTLKYEAPNAKYRNYTGRLGHANAYAAMLAGKKIDPIGDESKSISQADLPADGVFNPDRQETNGVLPAPNEMGSVANSIAAQTQKPQTQKPASGFPAYSPSPSDERQMDWSGLDTRFGIQHPAGPSTAATSVAAAKGVPSPSGGVQVASSDPSSGMTAFAPGDSGMPASNNSQVASIFGDLSASLGRVGAGVRASADRTKDDVAAASADDSSSIIAQNQQTDTAPNNEAGKRQLSESVFGGDGLLSGGINLGTMVGGGVGGMVAGPVGAIVGGLLGTVVSKVTGIDGHRLGIGIGEETSAGAEDDGILGGLGRAVRGIANGIGDALGVDLGTDDSSTESGPNGNAHPRDGGGSRSILGGLFDRDSSSGRGKSGRQGESMASHESRGPNAERSGNVGSRGGNSRGGAEHSDGRM